MLLFAPVVLSWWSHSQMTASIFRSPRRLLELSVLLGLLILRTWMIGQHAEYTEAQLVAFRNGTRANSPQMTGVAAKMNDREIKAVADYIAGLR